MSNEIQVILKPYSRPLAAGLENKRGVQVRVEVKSSAEKSQREILRKKCEVLMRSAECEDLFCGTLAGLDRAMNRTNVANASGFTSKEEFVVERLRQDLLRP